MRTNYLGSIWCLRAFLPGLEAAAPSDVVNIVSVAGVVAVPPSGPVLGVEARAARVLARDRRAAARRGIRVHTVKPGFVETEGFPQSSGCPRPLQRLVIGPEQIAEHVVALARARPGRDDRAALLRASAASCRRSCRIVAGASSRPLRKDSRIRP